MAKLARLLLVALALVCALPGVALAGVELAGNARGDQVILHRVLDQHTRPLYVGSRAAGGAFTQLVPISATGGLWTATASVDDGGGVVATLTASDYLNYATPISQTAIRPAGGAFQPPADFDPSKASPVDLVANASGDAIATDGSSYRFRPRGESFGPLTALPGEGPEYLVVDPDGSTVAFWKRSADGRSFESVRPPDGAFGAPTEIAPIPYASRYVSRDGRALWLWFGGSSLWALERAPDGHFGTPFKVADAPQDTDIRGVALAPSGAAAVAFGVYGRGTTVVARDAGGAFQAPRKISTPELRLGVNDAGDAVAVWVRRNHLVAATYRARGGTFGQTLEIAPARPFAVGGFDVPGVTIDGAGTATAGWEESDGAQVRTYIRAFDGSQRGSPVLVDSIASYARERPAAACSPSGSMILARSARSTVFYSDDTYGCLMARGTAVRLTPAPGEEQTQPGAFAFAGPLVAHANNYTAHSTAYTTINVTDLRDPYSGVNRSALAVKYDNLAFVAAIRLKRDAAVALVDCPNLPYGEEARCARAGGAKKQVQVWNTHAAKPQVLDSGRGIDPATFKLSGSRLSWRHGKHLRHAVLR